MIFPLLHANAAVKGPFLAAWSFDPLVTFCILLAGFAYGLGLQRVRQQERRAIATYQIVAFYAGLAVLALALLGPLDTYNDELFSMHMLQHLALMQIAAPLLLLGRPVQLALRAIAPRRSGPVLKAVFRRHWVRWALGALTAPLIATLLYNLNLVLWHVPAFYTAALQSEHIHELEHALFFGFALLFWWPIIDPVPRHHKAQPAWALASIFASMLFGIGLGALLTLANSEIYPTYLSTPKPWGLSPLDDQQIGGLVMWVGGGFLYMGILIALLIRTFGTGEDSEATKPVVPTAREST
ncbi:MAG TPA: cytochrome c oxidase assembly protein [Thermomicrobiaceae bacterium]|nr:cytochrome c oxidase assembly protein [Thermomicrobiaceae bacterium]